MQRQLERSNTDLQQFAYVAGHDLQGPLRSVISYLTLLERRSKDVLDPESQDYLHFVMGGGKWMRELISDLLQYARVESKGTAFTSVDKNEVVLRTRSNLKLSIENINTEIDVEPLPTIVADEMHMVQVMQNLIGNAIKFHGIESPKI